MGFPVCLWFSVPAQIIITQELPQTVQSKWLGWAASLPGYLMCIQGTEMCLTELGCRDLKGSLSHTIEEVQESRSKFYHLTVEKHSQKLI